MNYYIFSNFFIHNLNYLVMSDELKIGDRVTRRSESSNPLEGTIVDICLPNRYKVKWDKKSGKVIYDAISRRTMRKSDIGQQHSTLQGKNLRKVA